MCLLPSTFAIHLCLRHRIMSVPEPFWLELSCAGCERAGSPNIKQLIDYDFKVGVHSNHPLNDNNENEMELNSVKLYNDDLNQLSQSE